MADPDITRRLRGISGVASVNLVGAIERELVVEIRPRDLQARASASAQVVQALQSQNLAVAGRAGSKASSTSARSA